MTLLTTLGKFIAELGWEKKYWVGLSGGLDSLVLLSLCNELQQQEPEKQLQFAAIHVHHGLSPHADAWAQHCQRICDNLNITLFIHKIVINKNPQESLEEIARNKRYAVFAEYLGERDVLLTAHHQDDQAETFILQLARGSGLMGLASMPLIKPYQSGLHGRPLLMHSRAELAGYAQDKQLNYILDESNFDVKYARNFLRKELMPRLQSRYPSIAKLISRSANHCREAQDLLNEYGHTLYLQCVGQVANTLSVKKPYIDISKASF